MTLTEALQTGRPIKRPAMPTFLYPIRGFLFAKGGSSPILLDNESLIATDWGYEGFDIPSNIIPFRRKLKLVTKEPA